MFGLIRYKSDDFNEKAYSNSEMCSDVIVGVADNHNVEES